MSSPPILEEATADRLRDAALILLDAARAAHAENPDFVTGKEYIREPYALAVQALFLADIWNGPYGADIKLDPVRTCERFRGLAHGLGLALGVMPNPAQLRLVAEIQGGLNEGLLNGVAGREAYRR